MLWFEGLQVRHQLHGNFLNLSRDTRERERERERNHGLKWREAVYLMVGVSGEMLEERKGNGLQSLGHHPSTAWLQDE